MPLSSATASFQQEAAVIDAAAFRGSMPRLSSILRFYYLALTPPIGARGTSRFGREINTDALAGPCQLV